MKTILVLLATVGIATGAFAQGKVQLINNSTHLLTYSSNPADLKAGDAALAGTAIASPVSPNNTWMMELWGNPSTSAVEGSLVKLGGPYAAGAPVAGRFNGVNVDLPTGYPGGAASTPALNSFQIRFWEKTAANYLSYADALLGSGYAAKTTVFTANPGPAAANSLVLATTPSFSTWAAGPIVATVVPEPASASLIGLGLASLLIFRRRQ